MAFHIDLTPGRNRKTGLVEVVYETDYSIQDCVDKGWLDPTVPGAEWTRREIDRTLDEEALEDYAQVEPAVIPDPCFGTNLDLDLIQMDGRWVYPIGQGLALK